MQQIYCDNIVNNDNISNIWHSYKMQIANLSSNKKGLSLWMRDAKWECISIFPERLIQHVKA